MAEQVIVKDVNHIHPLPNFVEDGLAYLPSAFMTDKPNFMSMITIFLERFKTLDIDLVQLAEGRLLLNAVGAQLDAIGDQLGIPRNGLDDDEYRALIYVLAGNSSGSGTRTEVIKVLTQLFGEGNFNTYKGNNFRFDINIYYNCINLQEILSQLLDILPLPTHLLITVAGVDGDQPFAFEGDSTGFGFGEASESHPYGGGGLTVEIYRSEDELV